MANNVTSIAKWVAVLIGTLAAGGILGHQGYVTLAAVKANANSDAICEIRSDVDNVKKHVDENTKTSSNISERVARIEANTETILEIIRSDRERGR